MNLAGGLRERIREYDFKYTTDITRKNWINSTFPQMETLVNIVANIPYDSYQYTGDVEYTFFGIPNEDHGINEMLRMETFQVDGNNRLEYNFFGGICFELLGDSYPDVNLYDFVDPTSDIDIAITTNVTKTEKMNQAIKKITKEVIDEHVLPKGSQYADITSDIVVVNSGVVNPYFRDITDFVFENMLRELNNAELVFKNSVPFDITEYDVISNNVKTPELHFRVTNIAGCHAKLVSYLDEDLKTMRVQIVLKVSVNGDSIIDHLLEFLITNSQEIKTWTILAPNKPNYKISNIFDLIGENLSAYKTREVEVETEGPRRHKPINHITRVLYLLDLIRTYPNIYDDKQNVSDHVWQLMKGSMSYILRDKLLTSYVYYKMIDDEFTPKRIDTIQIIFAFYTVFCKMLTKSGVERLIHKISGNKKEVTLSPKEEQKYYDSIMSMIKMNASPFRKFTSQSSYAVDKSYTVDKSYKKDMYIMSTDKPSDWNGKGRKKTRRKTRRKTRKKTRRKTRRK